MSDSSIGARLKELRKTLGLNQTEVAEMCGVSQVMWGKYERGDAIPGGEVLAQLALRKIDIVYILTGMPSQPVTPSIPQISPEEEAILERYRQADLRGKELIEGAADLGRARKAKRMA